MTEKTVYICDITCPHCRKLIFVGKKTKIIRPAEKAEKEEKYFGEKASQRTLDQEAEPEAPT